MADYEDDFEIEEKVDGDDDHGVHKAQTKSTVQTESPGYDLTNRNNPRKIPLSTRKVQPLNNQENHKSLDLKNLNYSNTPQDYATKPKLKLLDINSSAERKSFDFHDPSESKDRTLGGLEESTVSINSKHFSKPFKIQKRSIGELQLSPPIDDHKQIQNTKPLLTKPIMIKKQPQQYNFDEEHLPRLKPNIPKFPQPIKGINNYVHSVHTERPNNYEKMKKLLDSSNTAGRTDREIEEENKNLRKQLREMNELLTKIIENRDISKIIPRRIAFNEKPAEEKLRTYHHEIQNNKKMIAVLLEEYHSLKGKVEHVKNPEYLLSLDEKIKGTYRNIEQIKKECKHLEYLVYHSGKNINNVENPAEGADDMSRYNEKARAIAVLHKRNDKIRADVEGHKEQIANQLKRIEDLNHKMMKLESLAGHYQVPIAKNPLQKKYNEIYKEVKTQEEAIKILLNRNEKFSEIYIDQEIDGMRLSIQNDKEHIAKLREMLRTQTTTMKELIAKETLNADKSLKELFDRFQIPTEEDKPEENRPISKNNERKSAKKPPLPKVLTEREELYKDLPLFTPKRESGKPFTIKKGAKTTRSVGRRQEVSPGDHQKQLEEIDNLYRKQTEEAKYFEAPKSHEKARKNEEGSMKKEETKQEPVEEKKAPFSKPFSIKRGAAKLGTSFPQADTNNNEIEKNVTEKTEGNEDSGLKMLDNKHSGQFESRFKDSQDLNYIPNSRGNYQGQPLRLPDEVTKGKNDSTTKLIPDTNANSRVDLSVNFGSVRGSQAIESKEPMQQEIPTEDFGFGPSRLNRGRVLKKEENSQELVLNFGGSTKSQEKPAMNNSSLRLNNESTAEKTENKPLTLGTKPNNPSTLEIKDPFAKYDDLSNLDFTKKKVLGGGSKLRFEDDEDEKPKGLGKPSLVAEKKEEPKPFTLSSHLGGPKNLINSNPFGQPSQPLTLNNPQPLTLNQNRQPQLRLGGDPGASIWNKKVDESEIETIGEPKNQNKKGIIDDFDADFKVGEDKYKPIVTKKDDRVSDIGGLNLDNNKNSSIWDRKEKDPGPIGGLKLDGNKNASIWDKKDKDSEPIGGLKLDNSKNAPIWDRKDNAIGGLAFGLAGTGVNRSIWDKKEPSVGIKDVESVSNDFTFKKKEETNSGLSFLNDKPQDKEGLGISTFGANKKEGLKFGGGGGGGSIWNKKETTADIKEIGSAEKNTSNDILNFGSKKAEPKKTEGLSFLNNDTAQDNKEPGTGASEEKKRVKKKKVATNSIDGGAENSSIQDSNAEGSPERVKKKKKKTVPMDGVEGSIDSGSPDAGLTGSTVKKKKKRLKPKETTGEADSNENTEVIKFGADQTSSSLDLKISKDKPPSEGLSLFGQKEEKSDVLSFLNDKPVNSEKKDPTALTDNTKKPRRMKMSQPDEKKKVLADGAQGNDFFDDLDI